MLGISLRVLSLMAFAITLSLPTAQRSQAVEPSDPWPDLVRDVFGGRRLADGSGLIAIDMPARAEDAGIVPVTLRATIPRGDKRVVVAFTLIIDKNPAPVAATFKVGSSVTMISTRVRVNDYTNVHAVAELTDGQLYLVSTFVKASGGVPRRWVKTPRKPRQPRSNALSTIRQIQCCLRSTSHDPSP